MEESESQSTSSSTSDTEIKAPAKGKAAACARKRSAKTQLKRPKALAVLQRPKVLLQDVRLSKKERRSIAKERKRSSRTNTVKKYESFQRRFEWFLEHDEEGTERPRPYNGNMVTAQAGVDVAVRFIQWVGLNFPGHEWPKKATELKIGVLEASAGRMIFLADMMSPKPMKSIGPSPALLLPFIMKGGKTLENGKSSSSGSIRHLIPAMCPHGSLGQHLVMRFTVGCEPFPSPLDFELWVTTPMWPGYDPRQNVSYSQQAQAIKHYLEEELGIYVRKVIGRMGKWNLQAMSKSYLLYFKPCGLLAAAGWPGASSNDYHQFWHPRFCVCVPQKLVDLLFPFLQNLKETVKKLGKDVTNSMKSVVLAMEYLAVVVVQDALEDAEEYPENPVHALLLDSPCFAELLQQYKYDKQTGKYDHLRPRTMIERMQDMTGHLLNIQGALPRPTLGALAAYSPPRGQPASRARDTYASQLAEHERAFQQLQDAAALDESHAEAEDVPAARELGTLSTREDTAQQHPEQHAEQQSHELVKPSREPHQGAGQKRHDHSSFEEAGLAEPANRSVTGSTTVPQFWKLWADGDEFNGKGPLKDFPPEIVNKKKQRYSEWRRAAEVVANRVAKMPSSQCRALSQRLGDGP
ncbi:g10750 [Coccomyxa elongata]